MSELRTPAEVGAWLAAGLLLRRVYHDESDEDVIARAVVACAHELPTLPPPGVIADVAILLGGTRLPLLEPITGPSELRAAIRAYDDDVLSRLVVNAKYDDVVAAFAHVPAHDRSTAVAVVVGAICERSRFVGAVISGPALRRALARPREERIAAGRTELAGGPITARLVEGYDSLARSARHAASLVEDREVFALDHLAVLRDLGGRMTADHIARAAEAFTRELPRRLPARRVHRGGSDTKLADDVIYPAGGFTAISPGGANASIENLVASELVYMEDGPGPDAFTLRYVEGELLFFTRDDSELRRHRHLITFVLGDELDDARVKDPGLPWQRIVIVLGMVLACVRWLAETLGDQALAIRIAFPPGKLDEERGILGVLLEPEVARGVVSIVEEVAIAAIADASTAARTAIADVVTVGASLELPAGLRSTRVLVQPREWAAWCEASEDLLRWLV